jgi:hypothetical protein
MLQLMFDTLCHFDLQIHAQSALFVVGFFFLTEMMCRAGDKHLIWPSNSNHLHVPILAMKSTTQM